MSAIKSPIASRRQTSAPKWIAFRLVPAPGLVTKVWEVRSTAVPVTLGKVRWSTAWRRYVFFPEPGTSYDAACLWELLSFVEEQTAARKAERERARA